MQTIGLFFGTDTGNSERIAETLKEKLEKLAEVELVLHDMIEATADTFAQYNKLFLSHPTWYYGELQSHWEDFWEEFQTIDFSNKQVACIGLGDQYDYADYFLDAMGLTHDVAIANGAEPCGYTSTEGFEHTNSKAVSEDESLFVGLALDEDQQPELTESRIDDWLDQIIDEMNLVRR